jgi:hypothetical protein
MRRTAIERAAAEHLKLILEPSGESALAAVLSAATRGLRLGRRVDDGGDMNDFKNRGYTEFCGKPKRRRFGNSSRSN